MIVRSVIGEILFRMALGVSIIFSALVVWQSVRTVGVAPGIPIPIRQHHYNKLISG